MSSRQRITKTISLGLHECLRSPLLVVLLIILPPSFITLSFVVTPDVAAIVELTEDDVTVTRDVGMADLHGAIMVPITTAFLAGLVGLFMMINARHADRRLVNSGYPLVGILAARLTIVAILGVAITVLATAVTLIDFRPDQLGVFLGINLISALHYAFIGAIVGTVASPMAGTYLTFFAPMIDIGVIQNPMFPRGALAWWAKLLPGYGPMEVLLDASFTQHFDTTSGLLVAVGYLAAVAAISYGAFWKVTSTGTPR